MTLYFLEKPMRIVELTGRTFERLTVLGLAPYMSGKHKKWRCRCVCGNEVELRGTSLTRGDVKSCGCLRREMGRTSLTKHGFYYHSAYNAWIHMMDRCHNSRSEDFKDYGARGITVCDDWHDVANFIVDMGERPPGASIDRERNHEGYHPGNCRWSNPTEQANNTRGNVRIELDGQMVTLAEAARIAGVPYKPLHHLIRTKKLPPATAIQQLKGTTT